MYMFSRFLLPCRQSMKRERAFPPSPIFPLWVRYEGRDVRGVHFVRIGHRAGILVFCGIVPFLIPVSAKRRPEPSKFQLVKTCQTYSE